MFIFLRTFCRLLDNLAVYRKVGPRLKQHHRLKRWMGQQRLDKFANYIETNLGALAGNFLLASCLQYGEPLVLFLVYL